MVCVSASFLQTHYWGQAESTLKAGLTQLFALAENYPNLKTDEAFQKLQTRISALETDIADRRELYNDSVNRNNIRIQQIPDVLIARACKFQPFTLLKFEAGETADVTIDKQFKSAWSISTHS